MSRRKKKEEEHDNSERWLLSYADFITLLMIFFVIMYAMSRMDQGDSIKLKHSISAEFGAIFDGNGGENPVDIGVETSPGQYAVQADPQTGESEEGATLSEGEKQEQVKEQLDAYIAENSLSDDITTSIGTRGLVVSFNGSMFFESGEAEIKTEQISSLVEVAKVLNQPFLEDSYIRVEGYTDNVPMNNEEFDSNWDLSVLRASNVAKAIISQSGIDPTKVSAVGYGEYRPKGDNNTAEGRTQNRRVDILILNSEFNDTET
ncbi:membrane motb of proton-channel complex mota/motb [Trichococcus palustris]|jgi:chemotaxis protein MotB|uniref:Membrane motb of proton-channel complex mota/motb n=1 Tax=Trichococcus palustris TaxID=140314 RepID=A0A143YZL5_9LACT|nr:OmpA family protein [Trichococcus palustris]CZR02713.1 membrane motb of proton-channel complex mota/motb [Trichococcus palustris]SFL13859.1 chemotaxis protein MotB [Trichococcus palustris]